MFRRHPAELDAEVVSVLPGSFPSAAPAPSRAEQEPSLLGLVPSFCCSMSVVLKGSLGSLTGFISSILIEAKVLL